MVCTCIVFVQGYNDNGKYIGNDINEERRLHNKRRRPGGSQGKITTSLIFKYLKLFSSVGSSSPCNFGQPKGGYEGRTFFDLQFFNVQHSFQTNINCGGGYGGGSYPPPPAVAVQPAPVMEIYPVPEDEGGHKPFGGHNRPLGGHRPLGGLGK